ncbi:leukotoxin LktA family filamentous adhesin [Stutzerimonas nosocomialis]|uniref:leukotoxin LktA family filamentous adhesin n=1 Tax=Stutzerimonas nosocomialis TaxID=1056496 RepID=UPI0013052A2C|nr:leukotoxin LktA family filamentous adhesin [Stutzerimonas nosocomialis]
MNHVYRTIWNHAKGVWQVVGEHTTRQGKTKSAKSAKAARSAGIVAIGALLGSPALYAQGIVTDGRTATSVTQTGNVTDVHTSTIRNGNGFNSFSRFDVDKGDVANLHVPDSAKALINIVRDQRSEINGILNGYQNGQIGGDIYFANPHGMVVGESGVINVGSLSVSTPDSAFLERMLGADGQINAQAVEQLKAGNVPLSESGLVSIRGQVNATGAITLTAQDVGIETGAQLTAGRQALPRIEQLVNIGDLQSGGALVEANGEIVIVAGNDVKVGGQVVADGAAGHAAGDIEIRAGRNIDLAQTARVSASGQGAGSDGGSVVIKAKQQSSLAKGGVVAANAGETGDGGFVELSADKTVTWGGSLEASAGKGGAAGHVLIDPEEILVSQDQRLGGTNYTLQASKRIDLADGVMISTRDIANYQSASQTEHRDAVSIGDSGSITLEAPTIALGEGAKLYAHTNTDAFKAGDITLKAQAAEGAMLTPGIQVGVGSNKAEILVGADSELRGGQVTLIAEASTALTDALSSDALYNGVDAQGRPIAKVLSDDELEEQSQMLAEAGVTDPNAEDDGFFAGVLDNLASTGLLASVQVLKAEARVDIGDRVTLIASDDVTIAAHAATNAQAEVGELPVGAVVSVTRSDAQLNVGQNVRIESLGGSVELKSQSDSTVETSVEAGALEGLPVTLTANVSHVKGRATTTVGNGSLIKAAFDATVSAEQVKVFDVSASAGDTDGSIGIAVLVALSDLQARNDFNGTLEAGRDANLTAMVDTQSNHHEAAVLLGDENKIVSTLEEKIGEAGEDPKELLQGKVSDGIKELMKTLLKKAVEEEKKKEEGAGEQPAPTKGFLDELGAAGALAYVNHDNQALVNVGGQAKVKAGQNANLSAEVTDLLDSQVSATISDSKNAEKPFDFSTESTGKKNGVGVAILISDQDNSAVLSVRPGAELDALEALGLNAKASLPWVDQSRLSNLIKAFDSDNLGDFLATINEGQSFSTWVNAATAVSGEGAKDDGTTLSGMVDINNVGLTAKVDVADGVNVNQDAAYRGQAQTVDVSARTESQMINVAADPMLFNNEGGKNGFGAGVIVGRYTNTAEATLGAVNLYANALNVEAVTDVDLLNYAVGGSKGGTNALSGSVAVSTLTNLTRAGIDDGANLLLVATPDVGGDLRVSARDETDGLTITGGVVSSSSRAAGVAAGVHDFDRTTEAWLGSRDSDKAPGRTSADGALVVDAGSAGRLGNYALSVAMTAPPAPSTSGAAQSREGTGAFGINVSGSAAVNLVDNRVSARVADDLDVAADSVTVSARDDSAQHAIAGGASVSRNTGNGVGLAGAYTQNTINAEVEAELAANGSVDARRVEVTARNDADALSISAGVSASASASSYQVAGSVSVNAIDATTRARLADGNLSARDGVTVSADDSSTIHAVAGAASFGGKAGVGAGLSINEIGGATEALVENLRGLDTNGDLQVSAHSEADLVSVAAAMGYSNRYAFDGSVAINQVDHDTTAAVRDSRNLLVGGALAVQAGNDSSIWTASGSAAIGNDGAMGAAFGYNTVSDRVAAEILNSQADAGSILVAAEQSSDINALVAGGAVAARSSAVAGSIAINTIDNQASARVIDADLDSAGTLRVDARDHSLIRSLTGALAFGGNGAGVGIAGSYNDISGLVHAAALGGNLKAGDLLRVSALRDQQLQSLAAGVGAGNATGVAGSVAVNRVGGATLAEIAQGAVLDSDGSLLLAARSDSDIETVAGALGVGLSSVGLSGAVAVNQLEGSTAARVTGGANLHAKGLGSGVAVDNGALSGNTGSDLRDRTLTQNVSGIAVIASSTDEVDTVAASVGVGGNTGVAGAVTTNLVGGSTLAEVSGGARLSSEGAAQVGAYHHTRVTTGNGAGAGGGTAGVGASVTTNILDHDTQALVNGASIAAAGALGLNARATHDLNAVVVGAAIGGTAGVNGSVAVTTLDGSVRSKVTDGVLTSTGGGVQIAADADNDLDIVAGGIAGGGVAGVGATVIVSTLQQSTEASTAGATRIDASGLTAIDASASQDVTTVGFTGAGGGTAGVAGTVNVLVANGSTLAAVGAGSRINENLGGAQQDVRLHASDALSTTSVLGTAGVGGVAGVGAGADVQVVRSGAVASVGDGAYVGADRDILIAAENRRDIDSVSVAAAGGGYVGAGAGVSVVSVAAGASAEATKSLDSSLASAQAAARNSGLKGQMGTQFSRAGELQGEINARQQAVSPNDTFLSAPDATRYSAAARVGNAVIDAGRNVQVSASNRTDALSEAAGVAAGLAGAGGGVSVINVGDRSLAELGGTLLAGGNVSISADDGQNGVTQAHAQAGGGGALGLGAAVAVSQKSSQVTARLLDGASVTAGGTLEVAANLDHALKAQTVGTSLGGLAIGASIATASTTGQAEALMGRNVQVRAGNIAVDANARSSNNVDAVGVSGGILLAGNAVVATAVDDTRARAWVGDGSLLLAQNAIGIRASTDPMARAFAIGAAVGKAAIGASVAVAAVNNQVQAGAGAVNLAGASLEVDASAERSRAQSAEARAIGAAGGALLGVNATVASADLDTLVQAELGQGTRLAIGGDASVRASDATRIKTDATGLAVGGALAIGANVGNADINASQLVRFGATGLVGGTLDLSATGSNGIAGEAVAGSGGVIAGSASVLNLDARSATTVDVLGSTDVLSGRTTVLAEHRLDYSADSNSLQAAMVGASGTFIDLDLAADTRVLIRDGASLAAVEGLDVEAHSITQGSALAYSGSGGVLNGSAVLVDNSIRDDSRILVGNGVNLATVGSPLVTDKGHLRMTAHNTLRASDTGRLSAGGAIAAPYAGTEMDVDVTNQVVFGNDVSLSSSGLLQVGAYSDTRATTQARVDVYGLVGAGGGSSKIDLVANQLVRFGANADLLAYGNIGLRAGQSADGNLSNDIRAVANTLVMNNTLIPVTAVLDADAIASTTNDLLFGSNNRVRSVRSIDLVATNGSVTADGGGVGKNPYLSLFSSEQTTRSSRIDRSATLNLANTHLVAGVSNRQELYWDGTTLRTVSALGDIGAQYKAAGSTDAFRPLAEIDATLAALNQQRATLNPASADYARLGEQIDLYTQMRASTAQALGAGANGSTSVDTLVISDIVAGAGDINVNAERIQQSGARLAAYGAPTVIIHNSSDDYLVTNGILVSAAGSGRILSSGAAKVANSGASLTEVGRSQSDYYDANQRPDVPSIVIENSYDTSLPGNTGKAPGILVLGDIENLKGSTSLSNVSGNVSQFATIESYQLSMNVPNGDLFVNLPGRNWSLASVQAEWANVIDGLSPSSLSGRSVPNSIAEFAANVVYNANGQYDRFGLNDYLIRQYGRGNGHDQHIIVGNAIDQYWETSDDYTANRAFLNGGNYIYTANVSANDHDFWSGKTGARQWSYTALNAYNTANSAALSQADTSGSARSALRVGGALAINARNINVNAGIEVGSRTDWSLDLGSATAAEIAGIGATSGLVRLNNLNAIADGNGLDDVPQVYWDVDNQRIQVQRIKASGGGSVSLTGNIINTNTLGNITVNSGYGDVQINNSTGHGMQLSDIDLGNGGQSVVRITDTLKSWGDGRAQTWWYVNQAGQDSVSVYNDANGATGLASAGLSSVIGREFSYNPQTGARYEWTHDYHITRDYAGATTVRGDGPVEPGPWTSEIATADGNAYRVSDGTVVVRAPTGNGQAFMQWADADIDYTTVYSNGAISNGWGGFDNSTQFNLATDIKLTVTNSVKADHAIPIRFVGNSESRLKVDSNADVLIGGDIRNDVGTSRFDVNGGALLQAGGSLQGLDLQLNATSGIGSADQALNIIDSRVTGASVSASSQGDIFLASSGDFYAKAIQASGDVTVRAKGGIYQHADAAGASISGDVLNLHSGSGSSIGGVNAPLITQSNEINASAPGNVTLTQAVGNMNVGYIESTLGSVELNTPGGQILGAAPKAEDYDAQLQDKIATWQDMGVTDANHADSTINGYENLVERYYGDYWTIRELANNPDGSFSLTATGMDRFRDQVAASLGRAPTNAEVNAAVKARYLEARAFLVSAPGVDQGLLTTYSDGFQYSLDTGSEQYAQMTHGAVWDKSMLGTVINAGAAAGERPSTGALANVSATQGAIRLNNDPNQALPESEMLVFTLQANGTFQPTVTQLSSSEGNSYSASQLLAFLSQAKPGTMEAQQVDGNTVRITLKPRYDLAVEAAEPVVINAKGDYHVGTSKDVILKDITVGGTLYVYAGRDVINQTAAGVAGAVTGGLYIDAGRNIGSPDNPIQVTNDGTNPVTVYRLVAPGTANVVVINGDVVIGKIDVQGETNLVANAGNFHSLGDHATFDGGLVNLRAVDGDDKTSGYIGTDANPFKVVQKRGALGLYGLGANVVAMQNDLVMAGSVLDGRVGLTSAQGVIRMDSPSAVIRTTDEALGQVNLVAATGIGETEGAVRLDTGRFNAQTPVGDVRLHLHREASAERVHALTGSAYLVGDGDGVLASTDLDLADVRVAKDLDLRAQTLRAKVTQTLQDTPLRVWATDQGGAVADRVELQVAAAPHVRVERLAARLADVRTDAHRANVVSGHIGEEMNLTTRHVSALMDNTTPALRYGHDFQYYIPKKDFSLDLEARGATGSRAPMWFDVSRGVFTRNMVTSGHATFDLARPQFSQDYRSTGRNGLLQAFAAAYPVIPALQLPGTLSNAAIAVNTEIDDETL